MDAHGAMEFNELPRRNYMQKLRAICSLNGDGMICIITTIKLLLVTIMAAILMTYAVINYQTRYDKYGNKYGYITQLDTIFIITIVPLILICMFINCITAAYRCARRGYEELNNDYLVP
jgi:predicted PurR-regulated permease PerM